MNHVKDVKAHSSTTKADKGMNSPQYRRLKGRK